MKLPHVLYRHYHATRANLDAPDLVPMPGDQAASNCAALHIGLDAMARIQAKRKPQAGCVASYPPIAPFPECFAMPVVRLYDLLAAHASKAGEASHPGKATLVTAEHKASARAFDVACHYRRLFRYWQG